jgi:DNA-binding CsgD family transcriptional regulator
MVNRHLTSAGSPAELEVVRLVGEGLRNDAIARRLFIAPGTVKVHLSHIFANLGITTRAELAAQAASQNLTARSADELTRAPPVHRAPGQEEGREAVTSARPRDV